MKNCYKNDKNIANRFTLTGGEKFKLGRIVFHVKELVTEKVQYYSEKESPKSEIYQSFDDSVVDEDFLSLTDDGHPDESDRHRDFKTLKL